MPDVTKKSERIGSKLFQDARAQCSIAFMAAFPLAMILLAFIFQHNANAPWPEFIGYFPALFVLMFFCYGCHAIITNKKYRIWAILFFIINIYFVLMSYLASVMAITGNYL